VTSRFAISHLGLELVLGLGLELGLGLGKGREMGNGEMGNSKVDPHQMGRKLHVKCHFTTVYNVRHELAISRREGSFSRNTRRGGVIKHQQRRRRPRQSTGDPAGGGKERRRVSFRQTIM